MDIKNYIVVHDDFLPVDVLNTLKEYCNTCDFEDAKIIGNKTPKVVDKIRKTQIRYLHKYQYDMTNAKWFNLLKCYFIEAQLAYQKGINLDCHNSHLNEIHILKYVESGHYDWHVDNHKKTPRNLSIIFYVNDDYEGGQIAFKHSQDEEPHLIKPKSNRIIIWPSNFMYPHKVMTVTKGTRYSVVSWII